MEALEIIFRLGVVFAIFSFIWGILTFVFALVRGGIPLNYPASLTLKAVQYFILTDVVVLFCMEGGDLNLYNSIVTGATLLMYFLGKVQNLKFKLAIVQIQGRYVNQQQKVNMKLEFGLVAIAVVFFVALLFKPEFANNGLATWFYESILDIEKTVFFGFIFKIIGFFFTIAIIFRMINALSVILTGGRRNSPPDNNGDNNENHFDYYEEVD